jgi:hypothetical protein
VQLFYSEAVELGEIAFVTECAGSVIGFVVGSSSPGRFLERLLRTKLLSFALAALPAVMRRPRFAVSAGHDRLTAIRE